MTGLEKKINEILLQSPFGKVKVKKSSTVCSLPLNCLTLDKAPNGCIDCVASEIAQLKEPVEPIHESVARIWNEDKTLGIATGANKPGPAPASPEIREDIARNIPRDCGHCTIRKCVMQIPCGEQLAIVDAIQAIYQKAGWKSPEEVEQTRKESYEKGRADQKTPMLDIERELVNEKFKEDFRKENLKNKKEIRLFQSGREEALKEVEQKVREARQEVIVFVNSHLHESPSCSYASCFTNRVWQEQVEE